MLLAVLLAAVFLALSLRGIAWTSVSRTLHHMRLAPLVAAIPLLVVSYLVRGLRWGILLRAETPVPRSIAVWASLVGYLANGFLPARAGEPIRAALVSRSSSVTMGTALATALSERLVDAALLTVIAVTSLASAPLLPAWLRAGASTMAVVAVIGLAGLFIAPHFEPLLDRLVRRLPLSEVWTERISGALRHFLHGLRALHSPKRALPFLALTLLIWTLDATVVVVVGKTVALGIGFLHALALLSALGLATAAPSTPGYLGIYQLVAVSVLEPLGAPRSDALVFIVTFQAAVYVVITVGGGLGVWALSRGRAAAT